LEGEGVEVVLVFVLDDMIDCDCGCCSLLFTLRKGEDVDDIVNGARDVSEGASVFEKLTKLKKKEEVVDFDC
jgi:hypothetical protein